MKVGMAGFSRAAAASFLAGLFCCWPVSYQQAQIVVGGISVGGSSSSSGNTRDGDTTSYRGQAAVAAGTALGLGLSVSDTGPLPSSGGAQETSLLSQDIEMMLSVQAAHAATIGQQGMTTSEASVGDLVFTTCNTMLVGGNTISA